MLTLIGLLLCVYLAFKGVQIFQIAYVNPEAPFSSLVLGAIMMIAGVMIAIVFALWLMGSAASVSPSL